MTKIYTKKELPALIETVRGNIGSWYAINGRLFEILDAQPIDETWPPQFQWKLRSIPIEGEAVVEGWVTDSPWEQQASPWMLIRKKPLSATAAAEFLVGQT